ncbi:MAG: aminoglycoside phosphotransferase family protein [Actinomycetes bacterium]
MTGARDGGPVRMPAPELEIDERFVRDLVDRQFPRFRSEPIEIVGNGWDNVVARLGPDLAVRVPRRAQAVPLVASEARWLPLLAERVDLEVPTPVHLGTPDDRMPWPWTIVRWVHGRPADRTGPAGPRDAQVLGGFLAALCISAPPDAPRNPFRGRPLAARDAAVRTNLARIAHPASRRLEAIWSEALDLPDAPGPSVWVHGDLHPANLIVRDGVLAGVIDWGDLTAGDPAADLQIAWTWPGGSGPSEVLAVLEADGDLVARARANALAHGLAVLANSADDPRMAAMGHRTIGAVLVSA